MSAFDDLAVLDKFLGDEGVADLCDRLMKKPCKRLILRGNCLGESGAATMAEYIAKSEDLEELSLEWNQIGSSGAKHLARALERNVSLEKLDLRNNAIRNDGAVALAEALKINKSITELDLRWNKVEDAGAMAFKSAILERIPRLTIHFSGNHLTGPVSTQIDNWLDGDFDDLVAGESKSFNELNFARSTESQNARDNMMKAEAVQLRKDMIKLQEQVSSLNKQLESSAIKVTETEQAVLKESFRADSVEEQLRSANLRITQFNEEISSLNKEWDKDRQEAAAQTRAAIEEKDKEMSSLTMERDSALSASRRDASRAERIEISLEEQKKAIEVERKGVQAELASLQSKLTEVSLSESKKGSLIATLEGRVSLAEATSTQLEKDLTSTREHSESELKRELKLREDMESKMKGDYEGQLSTLGDKTSRQAKELDLLYKKVSELQSELASKVADFELEKDKAITAARQEEAKRQEATLADQKQKIDMFLSGRGELQKRCDEYLQELTDAKETQKVANEQVAAQIAGAEAESSRLRQKVSELREESTKAKEGAQEAQKECEDLKKRNTQLSELNEEQASQLSIINNERTSLKGTVRELELETSQHHQQRQMMFKEIAERVKSAVDNEFDQLANKLDIVSSGPDQGK